MNPPATFSSPARPVPDLRHAFGGVWRLTFGRNLTSGHLGVVLGCAGVLSLLLFASTRGAGVEEHFLSWICGFYLTFVLPLYAFISAGGVIRDELKAGSVDYVFTRPLPRWAFVAFKFVAYVACVQFDFLLVLAALFGVGLFRGVPDLASTLPLLFLGQFMTLLAFSGFGFLCGMLTSRYVFIGLVYGAVIEIGVGQIPTALNRLAMTHQVKSIVSQLLINAAPSAELSADSMGKAAAIGVLVLFTVVTVGLAAAIFSTRELIGAGTREA